jgi:hypothetical protein
MAFLACLGIVQLAAARSGRSHLWLLRRRRSTRLLGIGLVITGLVVFYLIPLWTIGPWGPTDSIAGTVTWATASPAALTGARNINDTAGGLSGHWQALWFAVAWIGAVFFARALGRVRPPIKAGLGTREERILVDATAGGRP